MKRFWIGLITFCLGLTAWGLIEPRLLNVVNETATIPNLPSAWQGKLIGQVSDFQVGMWAGNPGTARRSISRLIEAQPVAVLISGDFVYHAFPNSEEEISTAVNIVSPLVEAGIPTYAVLGNHDYALSSKTGSPATTLASNLATALKAAGVVVLENESVEMRLPDSNESLYLVGVDSRWANKAEVSEALREVAPR